jgi:UDP-glucose 4-epimerase
MPYQYSYQSKTILVTGGAGAIGSNLVKALLKNEAGKVIILDNLSSGFEYLLPNDNRLLFIKGDIRNDEDLKFVFHHKPQIVFHLAAFFANQNSVDYPLINEDVNSGGLIKLLEYCVISNNIERFIYANSEGGAYGVNSVLPYREENISLKLSSPYYVSKLAGEAYCNYYHNQFGLPVSLPRLFNSYGPGEVPGPYRNVIPNFIYWAMQGQPLPLTGNEEISRDFVYVNDVVEGLLRAGYFHEAIGTPVNIATGVPVYIYKLAEIINYLTGNTSGTIILQRRKWDTRPQIIGDTKRCEDLLGFKPGADIETGLQQTVKWFHDHWKFIERHCRFPVGISSAINIIED